MADLQKVVEIIRSAGEAVEPLVQAAQKKVELERYVGSVFSREGSIDLDALCTRGSLFVRLRSGVGGMMYHVVLSITW